MPGGATGPLCVIRHARTAHAAWHLLNGRPETGVDLDEIGRVQCETARGVLPVDRVTMCVTSGFTRARTTARLLFAGRDVPMHVDRRLNELDYGTFEGRPYMEYGHWLTRHGIDAIPPSGRESQRQGLTRMAAALRDVLTLPGRPMVIAHGLLVSVLRHLRDGGNVTDLVFSEAVDLAPEWITDADVAGLQTQLARTAALLTQQRNSP